jgi:hypothetical protein
MKAVPFCRELERVDDERGTATFSSSLVERASKFAISIAWPAKTLLNESEGEARVISRLSVVVQPAD